MSLHSGAPERPRIIEEDERPGPPPLMSEERGKGRGLTILAAVLAVTAFAGVVWYAYDQGRRIGSETAAPLIKADASPSKVRPDAPGGMQVPHQDKLVLDDLGSGRGAPEGESRVERLLPPPETPVPAPEPLAEAPAAESSGDSATVAVAPAETAPAPRGPESIPPAKAPDATAPKALVPPPAPAPAPASASPAPASPAPAAEAPKAAPPAPKTAETAPATEAPAPAPKAPAVGDFNIQIAALRTEAAAEREWARVQSANRSLLGSLQPTYQRISTDNGVFFRVQGGPLTEAAAKDACAALKAKGQACLVVQR